MTKAIPLTHFARPLAMALATASLALAAHSAHAQLRYAGSDTVEPVIEAAQTAFARGHSGYKIQTQATGTGPGMRELCSGRAAIVGGSRAIKPEEAKVCQTAGIHYVEVPIALDAIALVVSTKNTWLKDLTMAEARTLFDPASTGKVTSWKQVRPNFPDAPIRAAGVGIKHGTFGFFSDALGLKGFIRSDFKDFNDHAGTGKYVAADAGAIGYMPAAEARTLDGQVRIVGIDMGSGVVLPGTDEIVGGKYDKLARTVYVYLNLEMISKASPQDIEFAKTLVNDTDKFVRFANLIPLRGFQYQENIKRASFTR